MNVSEKNVPTVLLEIGVFGLEENKDKIGKCVDKIQKQLDKLDEKEKNSVRIIYYLDKGEKTDKEKIDWINENTKALFSVLVNKTSKDKYKVPRMYVTTILGKIRMFKNALENLKSSGIKKQKIVPKEEETLEEGRGLQIVKD
jgi:hypothetical protein